MKTVHAFYITQSLLCLLCCGPLSLLAADYPQWRGPQRDGVSQEKGLMQEWPKEGPKLLWQVEDSGFGYSTPAAVGDRIYMLGNSDLENEFVEARSAKDGQRLWRTRLGKVGNPKQQPPFPAARSTPTIDGDVLYALGSDGDLACVELETGKVRWQKNLRTDFGGKPGDWAYSESPLVDGNLVVCTPGGSDAAMVGLNKDTGEIKGRAQLPEGDPAAYSSAILIEVDGVKQYVQMLEKGLVGVNAKNGEVLWRYTKTVSRFKANIPTPVARGSKVFSAGAGTGAALIDVVKKDNVFAAEEVYFSPKLPAAIGGAVLVGDYLFGTGNAGMMCVDFASGEIKWEDRALGAAAICLADGRLYLHGENGEVALVEPSPEGYKEKGRFAPKNQPKRKSPMEKAWAYPVVADGKLFIRDHAMLWCYDVKGS